MEAGGTQPDPPSDYPTPCFGADDAGADMTAPSGGRPPRSQRMHHQHQHQHHQHHQSAPGAGGEGGGGGSGGGGAAAVNRTDFNPDDFLLSSPPPAIAADAAAATTPLDNLKRRLFAPVAAGQHAHTTTPRPAAAAAAAAAAAIRETGLDLASPFHDADGGLSFRALSHALQSPSSPFELSRRQRHHHLQTDAMQPLSSPFNHSPLFLPPLPLSPLPPSTTPSPGGPSMSTPNPSATTSPPRESAKLLVHCTAKTPNFAQRNPEPLGNLSEAGSTIIRSSASAHPQVQKRKPHKETSANPGASSKVSCSCKASACLKLYCPCFANSGMCRPNCTCANCLNRSNTSEAVNAARNAVLQRDPRAFEPKVRAAPVVPRSTVPSEKRQARVVVDKPTSLGPEIGDPLSSGTLVRGDLAPGVHPQTLAPRQSVDPLPSAIQFQMTHAKGCNCRRGCEKKYCVCREAGVGCGPRCTCSGPNGCQNGKSNSINPPRRHHVPLQAEPELPALHSAFPGPTPSGRIRIASHTPVPTPLTNDQGHAPVTPAVTPTASNEARCLRRPGDFPVHSAPRSSPPPRKKSRRRIARTPAQHSLAHALSSALTSRPTDGSVRSLKIDLECNQGELKSNAAKQRKQVDVSQQEINHFMSPTRFMGNGNFGQGSSAFPSADSSLVKESDPLLMSPNQFVTPITNRVGMRGSPPVPMSLPTSAAVRAACEALDDPFDMDEDDAFIGEPFAPCSFDVDVDEPFHSSTPGRQTKLAHLYGVITPVTAYPVSDHSNKLYFEGKRDTSTKESKFEPEPIEGKCESIPTIPRATQAHLSVWGDNSSPKPSRAKAKKAISSLPKKRTRLPLREGEKWLSTLEQRQDSAGPAGLLSVDLIHQQEPCRSRSTIDRARALTTSGTDENSAKRQSTEGASSLETDWLSRMDNNGCIEGDTFEIGFPRAPRIFRFRLGSGQSLQPANANTSKK